MQQRMRRGCYSVVCAVAAGAAIWAGVTLTGVAQQGQREPYTWPRARSETRAHGFPLDDTAFVRFPLPASESAYAGINGEHIKTLLKEVVAISLKSKADGNKWWGRIAGTPYDEMAEKWSKTSSGSSACRTSARSSSSCRRSGTRRRGHDRHRRRQDDRAQDRPAGRRIARHARRRDGARAGLGRARHRVRLQGPRRQGQAV